MMKKDVSSTHSTPADTAIEKQLSGVKLWPAECAKWITRLRKKKPSEVTHDEANNVIGVVAIMSELARRAGDFDAADKLRALEVALSARVGGYWTDEAERTESVDEWASYWEVWREAVAVAQRRGVAWSKLMFSGAPESEHQLRSVRL